MCFWASSETLVPMPALCKVSVHLTGRHKQNFFFFNAKSTNGFTEGLDKFMSLNSSPVIISNSRCLCTTNYNKSGNCTEEKIALNMSSLLYSSISSRPQLELGGWSRCPQLCSSAMLMTTLSVKPLQKIIWFWYREPDTGRNNVTKQEIQKQNYKYDGR